MEITNTITIIRHTDGSIHFIDTAESIDRIFTNKDVEYEGLCSVYRRLVPMKSADRGSYFESQRKDIFEGAAVRAAAARAARPAEEIICEGIAHMINFFSEFEFIPNFRFINTVANKLAEGGDVNAFIYNYFALTDNPYAKEIRSKIKSDEFKNILCDLAHTAPKSHINSRFKVYYGAAGCGKTTKAQSETDNRCIVCNNSMLPADLMEDFVFVDGKPSFKPSILWECMEQGKPIVLDELNLLPFDSLRFLQGTLDGKREFVYKGHTVKIADGFCVIGTMNLVVNGAVFNLPEPLVDRAADIVEFNLTAEQLVSAVL